MEFLKVKNKTPLSIRIDVDLERLLRKGARGTLTSHVESLIVKGLITDMNDLYKAAICKGNIYRKTIEEKKILELEKRIEAMDKELETQSKILINLCHSAGVATENLQKVSRVCL